MSEDFTLFRKTLENLDNNPCVQDKNSLNDSTLPDGELLQIDKKPVILVIDDDLNVRDALKLTLDDTYNVLLSASGKEGIESINLSVMAVVLDIKMEGMNGFDTFLEIKNKNPFVPIIFHSAYQDAKNPMEIINDYRPFGYIVKGADRKELINTINSAVDYYLQINKNTELVKQLQNKNKLLLDLQECLELRVITRTEELTIANQELQKEITFRQNAEVEIKSLLEEKEIILQEVHHRIKNNMTTLKSLLMLQALSLEEPTAIAALNEAGSRVQSMMILYDKLYRSANFERMSIKEYIPSLVNQIVRNFPNYKMVQVKTKIEDFIISAKILQSLGIITNELLTNIMKYAFTDKIDCLISVEIGLKNAPNNNIAYLIIEDNGNGIPESVDMENAKGFGFKLIGLLAKQLKGTLQIHKENGTRIILEFGI